MLSHFFSKSFDTKNFDSEFCKICIANLTRTGYCENTKWNNHLLKAGETSNSGLYEKITSENKIILGKSIANSLVYALK